MSNATLRLIEVEDAATYITVETVIDGHWREVWEVEKSDYALPTIRNIERPMGYGATVKGKRLALDCCLGIRH